MKKILCVLLSLIMSVSLIAIPLSAQAETKYWVDMNFAKNNIEGLRNYVKPMATLIVTAISIFNMYMKISIII